MDNRWKKVLRMLRRDWLNGIETIWFYGEYHKVKGGRDAA